MEYFRPYFGPLSLIIKIMRQGYGSVVEPELGFWDETGV